MANFKLKDKNIIPEFVGALMKAVARRGSSKTIKKLQKDPIIRKNIDIIKKADKDLKSYIEKRSAADKDFKASIDRTRDIIKNL
tara:strand:+ start:270 stop:521 length:252 start_codon:yes stop_codon:yes gene_type:complete